MAEELEKGKTFDEVVREFISEHQRIIFNGDGYSVEWEEEAARKGLPNNKNTVDALRCLKNEKFIQMLDRLGVYSRTELDSRYDILLENYSKTIQVEGLTALKMAKTQIYPVVCGYLAKKASELTKMQDAGLDSTFMKEETNQLTALVKEMKEKMDTLEENIKIAQDSDLDVLDIAMMWRDDVLETMQSLRETVDTLENIIDSSCWPIPTYVDLLFGI